MFDVSKNVELTKGADMDLCEKHVAALRKGTHYKCKLLGAKSSCVHVCVFRNTERMQQAIRKFFDSKQEGRTFAKDSVGLAVGRVVSRKFVGLVFLTENASIDTLAHESAHIVSFYYEDKIKKYDLSCVRTNENYAAKVGALTNSMFNFVNDYKRGQL